MSSRVIDLVKPEQVFASTMGKKALEAHFHFDEKLITPVRTGESISLGGSELTFVETRMLHWPDSMVSYLDTEKVMFSQDGFGMHLASTERYDDQIDPYVLKQEAEKYFANILLPFSPMVTGLMKKLDELDLDIKLLCLITGRYGEVTLREFSRAGKSGPGRRAPGKR